MTGLGPVQSRYFCSPKAGLPSTNEEVDDAEKTADAIGKALYLVKQVSFDCLLI